METINTLQGLEKSAENPQANLNKQPAVKMANLEGGQRKPKIKWDQSKGMKFGRMTVIDFVGKIKQNNRVRCQCDCGTVKEVWSANLTSGDTVSCGCFQKENVARYAKKHGRSNSPEYRTWLSIKRRCFAPLDVNYYKYGGRGITMCDSWRNSFEQFYKDMGDRPIGGSIDRINNSLGYCHENCRWASNTQQQRNRSNNHCITLNGDKKCISEWAEFSSIKKHVILSRLRDGWSEKDSLLTPVKIYSKT